MKMSLEGFRLLQLYSEAGCRPFDARRDGLQLGEGSAALVLEAGDAALTLLDGAISHDPGHIAAGSTDGATAAQVMNEGLEKCGVKPSEISAIKAHGTATIANDVTELNALNLTFLSKPPPFTSLKSTFGHTLGGLSRARAGDVDLVRRRRPFPAPWASANGLPGAQLTPAQLEPRRCPTGTTLHLFNSFGFGGTSVSFVAQVRQVSWGIKAVKSLSTPGRTLAEVSSQTSLLQVDVGGPLGPMLDARLVELTGRRFRRLGRFIQLALAGAVEAAYAVKQKLPPERTGVFLATGLGNLSDLMPFSHAVFGDPGFHISAIQFANSVGNAGAFYIAQAHAGLDRPRAGPEPGRSELRGGAAAGHVIARLGRHRLRARRCGRRGDAAGSRSSRAHGLRPRRAAQALRGQRVVGAGQERTERLRHAREGHPRNRRQPRGGRVRPRARTTSAPCSTRRAASLPDAVPRRSARRRSARGRRAHPRRASPAV